MPGVTRELANAADFPRVADPQGDELIPAMRTNGEPVAVPTSAVFQISLENTLNDYVGDDEADFLGVYTTARDGQ